VLLIEVSCFFRFCCFSSLHLFVFFFVVLKSVKISSGVNFFAIPFIHLRYNTKIAFLHFTSTTAADITSSAILLLDFNSVTQQNPIILTFTATTRRPLMIETNLVGWHFRIIGRPSYLSELSADSLYRLRC
jgi:hypothetical protein